MIVTDQGTEFTGKPFTSLMGEYAALHHFIDSQSPWQQGRTERAGGALKDMIRKIAEQVAIITEKDFEMALIQALDARNRFINRSGYSAHQRVYGSNLRMPGSMLSDDPVDRISVAQDPTTEFQRSCAIRQAAQIALIKCADQEAVNRATVGLSLIHI